MCLVCNSNAKDVTTNASAKVICMAALVSLNDWSDKPKGGESKAGRFIKQEGDIYYFKSPKAEWKCKLSEDKRIFYGLKNGRWRTLPDDGIVKYDVIGDKIIIYEQYSDGSTLDNNYRVSYIRRLLK